MPHAKKAVINTFGRVYQKDIVIIYSWAWILNFFRNFVSTNSELFNGAYIIIVPLFLQILDHRLHIYGQKCPWQSQNCLILKSFNKKKALLWFLVLSLIKTNLNIVYYYLEKVSQYLTLQIFEGRIFKFFIRKFFLPLIANLKLLILKKWLFGHV